MNIKMTQMPGLWEPDNLTNAREKEVKARVEALLGGLQMWEGLYAASLILSDLIDREKIEGSVVLTPTRFLVLTRFGLADVERP